MEIPKQLQDRCAGCKHWQGNRDVAIDQLNKIEYYRDLYAFLDIDTTWCKSGKCRKISVKQHFEKTVEVDAVFSCILHEPVECDCERI